VKRALAVGLFVAGFAAAGVFTGAVIADTGTTTSTDTTATATTETTTVATTTTTTQTTPAATLPSGVTVSGIRVGGLTRPDAASAVETTFRKPLTVVVGTAKLKLQPAKYASAYVDTAIARARVASPGSDVELVVAVRGPLLRQWVAKVAKRFAHPAKDASLALKHGRPTITPQRPGVVLDSKTLYTRVVDALRTTTRTPVRVRTKVLPAKVSAKSFGPAILINRGLNKLYLYKNTGKALVPWRTFSVATGQSIYPTPKGTFHIVVKWVNPTWYPPTQDAWAKGLLPVPPGPGNPLGTRWMGLSAPGVGIHGTDEPGSIGYSASHGCIRMQVPDAEWLFARVQVGTTVFIV
jgi:lipoprotein-anchoring transpeptidase ErfK/SrfK